MHSPFYQFDTWLIKKHLIERGVTYSGCFNDDIDVFM